MHEILPEEIVKRRAPPRSRTTMRRLVTILVTATLGSISVEAGTIAAEASRKLSGSQIRAKVTNMQVTDEVHFRDVYDRDGTLRSYADGRGKLVNGPWKRTSSVFISRNRTTDVMKCRSLGIALR